MLSAAELNFRGSEMLLHGNIEGARLSYLAALEINPIYIPALANLASILGQENNLVASEALFRRLVKLDPNNGNHWNNLGNTLTRQDKYNEAFAAFDRAEALISYNPGFWHNKGLLLHRVRNYKGALRCFERVEALGGDSTSLQNDVAHMLLALGNLPSAFEKYEARWTLMDHMPPWDFHIPEWQGENLDGKEILLHAEQGYGDTIMTIRFVENVRKLGANVIVAVPKELIRLFESQNLECLDVMAFNERDAERFDFHSPLYSAMRWLEIAVDQIDSRPYIRAPEISVPPVFSGDVINIGICWNSGRRGGKHDWRMRHAPLEFWLPLTQFPNVQLWSLQKGPDSFDIQKLGVEALIRDPTCHFEDWADTAAFVEQLDLVISVDTAIVHLAGAMGKPCWMISQYMNCWRWWEIDNCSGRPWYDSVTIIPQSEPSDWKSQLNECVESLKIFSKIGASALLGVAA